MAIRAGARASRGSVAIILDITATVETELAPSQGQGQGSDALRMFAVTVT